MNPAFMSSEPLHLPDFTPNPAPELVYVATGRFNELNQFIYVSIKYCMCRWLAQEHSLELLLI